MALFVTFWGVRGSIPTPGPQTQRYGGNTSCVEVRSESVTCVCDAGTGLRELGQELIRRAGGAPITANFFFSHSHWDHIQGFPFFVPAYSPKNTFRVFGGEKMTRMLSGQMDSEHFPVRFTDLGSHIVGEDFEDDRATFGDIRVARFPQHHPGGSSGFVFEQGATKVVYSTDNELDLRLKDPAQPIERPADLRDFPAGVLAPYRGAALIVADAQYGDEEYSRKVGWGHPRATTAVDLAVRAGATQLALYHHDPLHTDEDVEEKVRICRERAKSFGSELYVFAAREGVELKYP